MATRLINPSARPSLKSLPLEIIDMILSKVCGEITNLAVISPSWQLAVERMLFATLSVNHDELPVLEFVLLSSPHRFRLISQLSYVLKMEQKPSPSELWTQNIHTLHEIRRLFTLLNRLSDLEPRQGAADLRLLININPSSPEWRRRPLKDRRLKGPRRAFPAYDDLPVIKVPSLAWLRLACYRHSHYHSNLDARLTALLLASVPSLQSATFDICEVSHWRDAKDHGRILTSAASKLNSLNLENLQDLTIHFIADGFGSSDPAKHCWTSHPNYIGPAQSIPFNLALRKLATRLQRLQLLGGFFVAPDFFCPNENSAESDWIIKNLRIQAHPACTHATTMSNNLYRPAWGGGWGGYKLVRDQEKHGRLAVAILRAMMRMPELERLVVDLAVRVDKEKASTSGDPEAHFVFERSKWNTGENRGVIGGFYRKLIDFDWQWKVPGQAHWYWSEFRERMNREAEDDVRTVT
ncbi:hypothetical protein QBC34DRAFT_459172 [Podospora aff. communis PSN243]|uniref:F-box domain-containing protein n=1 Tax=Podospora aff. communis PSN243 TaxID=3040156 RepID=A0AAV9GU14_9PEZI|nr:hypothetical protein QBC34DRAFT_459172 [Podospora aff. communis PSN243]